MQKCFGLRLNFVSGSLKTHIVIASRAERTAWQSPEIIFK